MYFSAYVFLFHSLYVYLSFSTSFSLYFHFHHAFYPYLPVLFFSQDHLICSPTFLTIHYQLPPNQCLIIYLLYQPNSFAPMSCLRNCSLCSASWMFLSSLKTFILIAIVLIMSMDKHLNQRQCCQQESSAYLLWRTKGGVATSHGRASFIILPMINPPETTQVKNQKLCLTV